MTDPTLNRGNCECKYCAKVPQRVISENLGFLRSRSTPTSTPSPGTRLHRVGRERERRLPRTAAPSEYATVRRAPKPKQERGPSQVMLQERYYDVQAMYADTTAELRRWFRTGELVWCALDPAINGVEAPISFWPGLVDDCSVKSEALPRPKSPSIHSADGDFEMEDGTDTAQTATKSGSSHDAGCNGGVPYPITPHPGNAKSKDSPLPWIVRQKTIYKVKLLGINHDYVAVETQVLPYQGYTPSRELLRALQNVPIDRITSKPEEIAAFNPCPPDEETVESGLDVTGKRFEEATAPYTLAVEIAAGIAVCWTPTDDWDFKMVVPPPSPSRTVDPALASASATASESETYSLRSRAPQEPSVIDQTRYQGLWLGAERIWTDDLVRLKAARGQIAPDGSPQIVPPSGPSKSSIAQLGPEQQTDEEVIKAQGARDRGVFMQLEALFVVEVPDANGAGVHAECRGSGMLYELADEDWEEPQLGESSTKVVEGEDSSVQDGWAAAGLSTPPRPRHPGASPELHVGQPFMSAPSPLKQLSSPGQEAIAPTPLVDNVAPVETSVSTPTKDRKPFSVAGTTRTDADAPNTQLSRPKNMNSVPLPPPPRGFRFRPILPEGFEVVVSLSLVSGRYYPRLLAHPLLRPIVRDMQAHPNEVAGRLNGHPLLALEGILPGFFNASEATRWKPGRAAMVRDAAAERSAGLARVWEVRRQQALEATPPPVAPEQADVAADAQESGPSKSQEQAQEQEQVQKQVQTQALAQAQVWDEDMEVPQSEILASVAAISTSTEAPVGPSAQSVEVEAA